MVGRRITPELPEVDIEYPEVDIEYPEVEILKEPMLPFAWDGTTNTIGARVARKVIEDREINLSSSVRNGPIPYVIGKTRVTGQLIRKPAHVSNRYVHIPYFLCRIPPGMTYSFENYQIDKTVVSEGTTSLETGIPWIKHFAIKNGSMTQEITTTFAFPFDSFSQRLRTFSYVELIIDSQYPGIPELTQTPVVTVDITSPAILDWYDNPRQLTNLPTALWWFLTLETRKRAMPKSIFENSDLEVCANECDIDVNGEALWSGQGQLIGNSGKEIAMKLLAHFNGRLSWNWGEKVRLAMFRRTAPVKQIVNRSDFLPDETFSYRRIRDNEQFSFIEVGYTETKNYTTDTTQYRYPGIASGELTDTQAQLDLFTSASTTYRWAAMFIWRSMLTQLFGDGGLHSGIGVNLLALDKITYTDEYHGLDESEWVVDSVQSRIKDHTHHIKLSQIDDAIFAIAYGDEELPELGSGLGEIINPVEPNNPETLNVTLHHYEFSDLQEEPIAGRDLTAWTASNMTVNSNVSLAPDGTSTADKITATANLATIYNPNAWPDTIVRGRQRTFWTKLSGTTDVIRAKGGTGPSVLQHIIKVKDYWRLATIAFYEPYDEELQYGPLILLEETSDECLIWSGGYQELVAANNTFKLTITWDEPEAPWLIDHMRVQMRLGYWNDGPVVLAWENWGPKVSPANNSITIGTNRESQVQWFPIQDPDPGIDPNGRFYDWRVCAVGINGSIVEVSDPDNVTMSENQRSLAILRSNDFDQTSRAPDSLMAVDSLGSGGNYLPISGFYTKWERLLLTWTGTPFVPTDVTLIMAQNTETTTTNSAISIIAGNQGNSLLRFGDTDFESPCSFRYNHADDDFHLKVNDSEVLTILSDGKTGIGETTPTSELDVAGKTTTESLLVTGATTMNGDTVVDQKSVSISGGSINASNGTYFVVTGTGNVTSITGGYEGKRIILRTANDSTTWIVQSLESTPASTTTRLSDGSMFFDSYSCSLELIHDGTYWTEVDRAEKSSWDDVAIDVLDVGVAVSPPDKIKFRDNGAGSTGVYRWGFRKNKIQDLFWGRKVPHGYEPGTNVYFSIQYTPMASITGSFTINWEMEITASHPGEIFPATSIISVVDNITDPVAYEHRIAFFPVVSGTGFDEETTFTNRISRLGTTAGYYTDYVALITNTFHFKKQKRGTNYYVITR